MYIVKDEIGVQLKLCTFLLEKKTRTSSPTLPSSPRGPINPL
jgi:hypothetical protein